MAAIVKGKNVGVALAEAVAGAGVSVAVWAPGRSSVGWIAGEGSPGAVALSAVRGWGVPVSAMAGAAVVALEVMGWVVIDGPPVAQAPSKAAAAAAKAQANRRRRFW